MATTGTARRYAQRQKRSRLRSSYIAPSRKAKDVSIAMLERAARDLAPFLDEVAFLGGATIALWITDEAAPEPRLTKDVDVVVEVASRPDWYRLES